jgi:hypothetical protein
MNSILKNLTAYSIFLICFLLLFLQYPLNESLVGNWDNWFNLSLFENYSIYINKLFRSLPLDPTSLYPIDFPFLYGEPMFVNGLIYYLIKFFVKDPIYGWYILVSILFSLNSFSLFLVFKKLNKGTLLSLLGGFLISLNSYVFCSMDQLNVISFYPIFFSIYFLIYFKSSSYKVKYLFISLLFLIVQLYCSGYYFFLGSIVWILLYIYYIRWYAIKPLLFSFLFILISISPYLLLFVFSDLKENAFNPMASKEVLDIFSFDFNYFFNSHPFNLLYGDNIPLNLLNLMRSYFVGYAFLVLSIIGLTLNKKHRLFIILLVIIGFLLSSGPTITIGSLAFDSPIQLILDKIGLSYFFRTPLRAYFILLICMIFSIIHFFDFLKKNTKRGLVYILLLFGVILIENIPYKFQYYNSKKFIVVPEKLSNSLKGIDKSTVLLFLPSSILSKNTLSTELDESNREYIYMYWQTQLGYTILNGMNGFVPNQRLELDSLIKSKNCEKVKDYVKGLDKELLIIHIPCMLLKNELEESFYEDCADLIL